MFLPATDYYIHSLFIYKSKCRITSKYSIVEVLYLDLEDLKQSKSEKEMSERENSYFLRRAAGLPKIWSWLGPLFCSLPRSDICFTTGVAHQWQLFVCKSKTVPILSTLTFITTYFADINHRWFHAVVTGDVHVQHMHTLGGGKAPCPRAAQVQAGGHYRQAPLTGCQRHFMANA